MEGNFVTEQLCAARRNTDDERFSRDLSRIEKAEARIDDMEKLMHEMSECNAKLTIMVENLNKKSENHEDRITDIEKKPGTYWDKIVAGVIGAIVTAVMAVILKGGAL